MYTFPFTFEYDTGQKASLTTRVYGQSGVALASQPAFTIEELLTSGGAGTGVYQAVTTQMPDGQVGSLIIFHGATVVDWAGISPYETEGRIASAIGGGDKTVTFTVLRSDNSQPVVGAAITVKSGSTVVAWGTTDAAGKVKFGLASGSYTYTVTAGGLYVAQTDVALNVTTDPQAVAVSLVPQSITPAAGGLCTVRFYVTLNRVAQEGYRCQAKLVKPNSALNNELLSSVIDDKETAANGIAELVLVQKSQFTKPAAGDGVYEIKVAAPDGTVTHQFRAKVPDQSTADVEDLIPVSA